MSFIILERFQVEVPLGRYLGWPPGSFSASAPSTQPPGFCTCSSPSLARPVSAPWDWRDASLASTPSPENINSIYLHHLLQLLHLKISTPFIYIARFNSFTWKYQLHLSTSLASTPSPETPSSFIYYILSCLYDELHEDLMLYNNGQEQEHLYLHS